MSFPKKPVVSPIVVGESSLTPLPEVDTPSAEDVNVITGAATATTAWLKGPMPFDPKIGVGHWRHSYICSSQDLSKENGGKVEAEGRAQALKDARDKAELLEGKRELRPGETLPTEKAKAQWQQWRQEIEREQSLAEKVDVVEERVNDGIDYRYDPKQKDATTGELVQDDIWSLPDETLESMKGDCEDYALLKYTLLEQSGVSVQNLSIAVVYVPSSNEDHAVLLVKNNETNETYVLDNRRTGGRPSTNYPADYLPDTHVEVRKDENGEDVVFKCVYTASVKIREMKELKKAETSVVTFPPLVLRPYS